MSKKAPKSPTKQPARIPATPEPVLTPAQKAGLTKKKRKAEADRLVRAEAQRLAQIVNLHIAGMSLAEIGAAIGMTADQVDQMIQKDAARYIRSQPQLRNYVRGWISREYEAMLRANRAAATDEGDARKLENQDRSIRLLDSLRKLHGADAPVQQEIRIEATPEAVEEMVVRLSRERGQAYDDTVFDVEVIEDVSGNEEQ